MKMKRVTREKEDRQRFLEGVRSVTRPVKSSIGVGGSTTMIQKPFTPIITKDGKTIANEVQLTDPVERLGADASKMVSNKTDEIAHDSTSTSLSLWDSLIHGGFRLLDETTVNRNTIARGLRKAAKYAADKLRELSVPVKDDNKLRDIAYISANNDSDLADHVFRAFSEAGENNPVVLDSSRFAKTVEVEIEEGLNFEMGYMSPMFMTDPGRGVAEFMDVSVLLLADPVAAHEDMIDILDKVAGYSRKPLLIIASAIEGQAFGALVYARHPQQQGQMPFPVVPVRMPKWGADEKYTIEDISLITGATPIGQEFGVVTANFFPDEHLGHANHVVIYNDHTVITGGKGYATEEGRKAIEAKIQFLRAEAKKEDRAIKPIEERISKLSGKVAVVVPGAPTEIDAKEIRWRLEDAIGSVRSAIEHGYLPGGGSAMLFIANEMSDPKFSFAKKLGVIGQEEEGVRILINALREPARDNVFNVGRKTVDEVFETLSGAKWGHGYNGATNAFEDLLETGVIDSALGQITALESAVSIAAQVISSRDMIVEDDAEEKGTVDNPFVG